MIFGRRRTPQQKRHEQFEATGEFLLGAVTHDDDRIDDALGRVDPGQLQGALLELARRAVIQLAGAREATADEVISGLVREAADDTAG